MRIYRFEMDREGLDDFVAKIVDAYEFNLGTAQSAEDALSLTQDITIASIEDMMATSLLSESKGKTKH